MSGRTSTDSDVIRHQQKRDLEESESPRGPRKPVGAGGLSGVKDRKDNVKDAIERATREAEKKV